MPIVAGDWSVTRSNGNIRYIGDDHGGAAPSYATVIEFHRWLQDLADDASSSGDDEVDITDALPSDRSTDNIITLLGSYNIDATAAEHLYDGSIIQASGDEIYDGIVNFGNVGVMIQLHQDGAVLSDDYWNFNVGGTHDGGNNVATLTDSGESWTTDQWVGYIVRNVTDGSQGLITANTATTITAVLEGGTEDDWDTSDAYLISEGLNSDSAQGISHRFMVQTRADGVDIDGRRILGTNRTFGRTYGEFRINGTSRGNNVLALTDAVDLNNSTALATVAGWGTITNTEGLRLLDIDGDTVNEEYYSEWNRAAFTINQFYERMKERSRDNTAANLHGISGELFRGITHSFAYDNELGGIALSTNDQLAWGTNITYDAESGGPFTVGEAIWETAQPGWRGRIIAIDDNGTEGELIVDIETGTPLDNDGFTGQSSSATANVNGSVVGVTGGGLLRCYAVDDDGATGNLYVQVLRGTAPSVDNQRLHLATTPSAMDFTDSVDLNGAVTERTISTPFIGASTGSALIGAYGIGMETTDTSASDLFFDLSGTSRQPPNNVTFTVAGLVVGEDRLLVTTDDGGGIDFDQYTLNGALTSGTTTAVVVNGSIESETPSTGTIRIERNSGLYSRHPYSAASGSTFTITSADFSTDNAGNGNNVFNSYLDLLAASTSENFTYVYSSDRTLFIRVRDGAGTPIKEFVSTGTMGSNGGSVTAIRTSDA